MSLFGKETPKPKPAAPEAEALLLEFDPHAMQSVIKQGGKKKLDTLISLFKAESPKRVEEIERASDPSDAAASARVLKSSAANLGLMGLEDACDKIIAAGKNFSSASPLAKRPRALLTRALDYLERGRKVI